jgi:hypothetical protein
MVVIKTRVKAKDTEHQSTALLLCNIIIDRVRCRPERIYRKEDYNSKSDFLYRLLDLCLLEEASKGSFQVLIESNLITNWSKEQLTTKIDVKNIKETSKMRFIKCYLFLSFILRVKQPLGAADACW